MTQLYKLTIDTDNMFNTGEFGNDYYFMNYINLIDFMSQDLMDEYGIDIYKDNVFEYDIKGFMLNGGNLEFGNDEYPELYCNIEIIRTEDDSILNNK